MINTIHLKSQKQRCWPPPTTKVTKLIINLYTTLKQSLLGIKARGVFLRECAKILIESSPEYQQSTKKTEVIRGMWYHKRKISSNQIKGHGYFQKGESVHLIESLYKSQGREAHLSYHPRNKLIITYNCNGMLAYCGGIRFDKKISQGHRPRASNSAQVLSINKSIIAYQRNSSNYFHFITEVLTSLLAHIDLINKNPNHIMLLPNIPIAKEAMNLLGIKNKMTMLNHQGILRCRDTIVLDLIPAGFASPSHITKLKQFAHTYALTSKSNSPSIIFLNRGKHSSRQLSNAQEVLTEAKNYFPEITYVETDTMKLRDQIKLFKSASIIISPQGAHAINLIWSENLEHYVEITPNYDNSVTQYAEIIGAKTHLVKSDYTHSKDFNSSHSCDLKSLQTILGAIKQEKTINQSRQ